MKKFFALFLLPVLFLLSGCISGDTVRFGSEDNGSVLKTDPGKNIVIRLESNPTTGYSWSQNGVPDSDVIRLVEEKFEVPEVKDGICGAPGAQLFTYHVFGPGTTAIKLEYKRPWEKELPAETFQIRVIVDQSKSLIDRLEPGPEPTTRVGSKGQIEEPYE